MKQTPYWKKVTERMAPGVLSLNGFLGEDPRRIEEIIEADNATVNGLWTTHEALSDKLMEVYEIASAGLGAKVAVADRLKAGVLEVLGRIPCPFGGCGTFPKGEVELVEEDTGRRIRFTPMSIHMIRTHGFYEGVGSRYRVDPKLLYDLFHEMKG